MLCIKHPGTLLPAIRILSKKYFCGLEITAKSNLTKLQIEIFILLLKHLKIGKNERELEKMIILSSGSAGYFKHNKMIFNKIIKTIYFEENCIVYKMNMFLKKNYLNKWEFLRFLCIFIKTFIIVQSCESVQILRKMTLFCVDLPR